MKNYLKSNKWFFIAAAAVLILGVALLIYPNIEIQKENKIIMCRYSDDISEFEENPSYNELYFYNEKRDISVKNFQIKNFLFFHTITVDYIKGDFRKTQFLLEESFIEHWLHEAEIIENEQNIDIAELIKDKQAIVGNTRYLGNEYDNAIFYKLDGSYGELWVFYVDDLLVIQVGSPDELPKFIAYK